MHGVGPKQLARLVTLPLVTTSVLAAVLVWEIEHVGSVALALAIASVGVLIAVLVARSVRRRILELATYYEDMLRLANEQSSRAEEASRARDQFLATLSHELRTPLNSVLGWTRLLASGRLDREQAAHALRAIERAAWTQARFVDDLLDISRIVTGRMQIVPRPAAVEPVVQAAVDAIRPAAAAKHTSIVVACAPDIGRVAADPDRLRQIVWNLLSNAVKFTPAGGRVSVELERSGADVQIAVTDNGIGFSPDTASRLFDRFSQGDSTTTRPYGGLGLGLGIVRHLVELHGGTISAHSDGEGKGSRFVVKLPLLARDAAPAVAQPAGGPAAERSPMLRGVSVLLVDDDPTALESTRSNLERYGATVSTATSAREARDRFARQPPDVLISDLMMRDEDGLQLIRQIREIEIPRGIRTPAAALTGLARSEDRRRALSAGYQMHLAKPIDAQELATVVERLVVERGGAAVSNGGHGRPS
jgi:signal transduction histidine kinase/CheY-like chemotaxis protein